MVGVVCDSKVSDKCVNSGTGSRVVDVEDSVNTVGAEVAWERVRGVAGRMNCGVGDEEADTFVSFDGIGVELEMVRKKLVGRVRVE